MFLEKVDFDPNLVFFFSITTELFALDFANSILLIVFLFASRSNSVLTCLLCD